MFQGLGLGYSWARVTVTDSVRVGVGVFALVFEILTFSAPALIDMKYLP